MLDRVPTKPNRYAVYDDAHNFIRYEYHERADEPTQVGDALNKANLLPDDVATALGLTGNPQVKDALNKLKTFVDTAQTTANGRAQIATGSYTGTGTYGSSSPNSLSFGFAPKFVIVFYENGWLTMHPALTSVKSFQNGSPQFSGVTATFSANTVSWYSSGAYGQMNNSYTTYAYFAIG